jgi:hypothetical protein
MANAIAIHTKRIILMASITCFAVGTAAAQSCDSKAVGANGKTARFTIFARY